MSAASTPSADADRRIPVTLLTGFLGAGKTTLLNHLLRQPQMDGSAVLINEFGAVGVDHHLVEKVDESLVVLDSGCICCSVQGDLVRALKGLFMRALRRELKGLRRVLIETTGLADPAPVVQTFFVDEDVQQKVDLDAVVTVVDARHFLDAVDDAHELAEQVAFADTILLNKTDLVDADTLAAVRRRIASLNRFAKVMETVHSAAPLDQVLHKRAFDLSRILEIEPGLLTEEDDHEHDANIISVSLTTDRPLEPQKFSEWIRGFIMERGVDVLRTKGILNLFGQDNRYVFQGVHMVMDSAWGAPWAETRRSSKLVFIGRNLDQAELDASFQACTVAA